MTKAAGSDDARKIRRVGSIHFVELDLGKYRLWMNTEKSILLTMEHDQEVRNAVYNAAEILKHKHSYAFFFLVGLLNNIVNPPICYKADTDAEQLAVFLEELERVMELQEIFREAVGMYLDKESEGQSGYRHAAEYPRPEADRAG
jgi:hypothetical protein